jgi:AbrB family looped-hinge helix DNA binding protein
MQATLKIGRASQIVVPLAIRETMGLKIGDYIIVDFVKKVVPVKEGDIIE